MEFGINGFDAALGWWYKDLGLTWLKHNLDVVSETNSDWTDTLRGRFDRARAWDMRIVLDLRTTTGYLIDCGEKLTREYKEQGWLLPDGEDVPREDRLANVFENEQRIHRPLQAAYAEGCAFAALQWADWCEDFEIWGESACPYVTGGAFNNDLRVYSAYLEAASAAIKAVRPQCRVWTGGNGFDQGGISSTYFRAIGDDSRATCYDVANWHPYHMYLEPDAKPAEQAEKTWAVYMEVREDLSKRGKNQPYAATEWGFPSLGNIPAQYEKYLKSYVVNQGVRQMTGTEAVEWAHADLQVMHDAGFQVVCLDRILDEEPPQFWGERTGVVTFDFQKKPIYAVVQEWSHAGKSEPPAFAGWCY